MRGGADCFCAVSVVFWGPGEAGCLEGCSTKWHVTKWDAWVPYPYPRQWCAPRKVLVKNASESAPSPV